MNKHRKAILGAAAVTFILIVGVVAFIVVRNNNAESEGEVAGAISFVSNVVNMKPGTDQTVSIKSNIGASSVDGFQLVINITGTIPSNLAVVPSDLSSGGLNLTINDLSDISGGKKLTLLFITADPQTPFQRSGDIELAKLTFTVPSNGEMSVITDTALTKVLEHNTGNNIVTIPVAATYYFTLNPGFRNGNPPHKSTALYRASKNDVQTLTGFYDNDTKTDIAIFDPMLGRWFIKYTGGAPDANIAFGWLGVIPIGGSDYDGDGRTDLAIFEPRTGHWYIRPSQGGADWDIPFGWGTTVPVGAMKFDSDNKVDLTIYDTSSGHWYIRPSEGGADSDILFGWDSTFPVAGNYFDDDDRTELTIFDRGTGRWHIRYSTGAPDGDIPFGWSTVIPVGGGKYDNDNITDMAIFEPNTGHWYIRPSAGGPDRDIAFGWLTTIPKPGLNLDNDTTTDLAIFDTYWGHWYVRPSSGGFDRDIPFGWQRVISL